MKVYITEYALTKGILEKEAKIAEFAGDLFAHIDGMYKSFLIGYNVFYTKSEAKQKAEEMRTKRIESLKKQIQKLEKMKF